MCDSLCLLIEHQSHCVKNHKFLIASLVEHVVTQVVPVPKPRAVELTEEEKHRAGRSTRRAEKKQEAAKLRAAEKQKKIQDKKGPVKKTTAKKEKEEDDEAVKKATEKVKCIGEEELPDFEEGKTIESAALQQPCMWDAPITYELQVELLLTLQRLAEQFTAAAGSIQQSRPFDGVCVVVTGCIAALSDAIIRTVAVTEPSVISAQLSGKTIAGKQLGFPGFGISVGSFATQVKLMEEKRNEIL